MIQVILGEKGTGKTKRLIDMTNDAVKVEHGDIVFIDDDKRYMYDLRHEIRFVDASEYVKGFTAEAFLAFVSGMLAANFDISMIFVDAFRKLVTSPLDAPETAAMFQGLERLSAEHSCGFVLSVSQKADRVPEYISKYAL